VVRRDAIRLVAQEILTIFVADAGSTQAMAERVPKIVNTNLP
jgi:hypothetical protein